jgi:hypothetical protein
MSPLHIASKGVAVGAVNMLATWEKHGKKMGRNYCHSKVSFEGRAQHWFHPFLLSEEQKIENTQGVLEGGN